MPRPVYILCSESGSQDASTNLVSHFQVIETMQISPIPESDAKVLVVPAVSFRMTAVWMKKPEDPEGQEYDFETVFYLPPDGEELIVQTGKFAFDGGKLLYRMIVIGLGPPFKGAGLFRVESRIRAVGQQEWLTQDYLIPISLVSQENTAEDLADCNGRVNL